MPPRRRQKDVHTRSITPPAPTFRFINLSDQAKIRVDDDRSIIREVVMNDYHQKKKHKKLATLTNDPPRGSVTVNTPISKQINVFQLSEQTLHSPPASSTLSVPYRENEDLHDAALVNTANSESNDITFQARPLSHDRSARIIEYTQQPRKGQPAKEDDTIVVQRIIENLQLPKPLKPLSSLPASATPRSQYLIDRFFQDRGWSSLLMMGVRKSWFQASLEDLAYFNVILAHYSACITLLTKAGDPLESLVLRMEASKIVNERLGSEETMLSDGTIGAVASLLMYEANNGNYRAIMAHMTGLHRMVNLRGGFEAAGFTPAVQRQIAWAEITISNTLSISPKILPFSSPGLNFPAYTHTVALLDSSNKPTVDLIVDFSIICTDIEIIFEDLRYLTKVLETQSASSISDSNSMFYSDKTYLVQRSLNYLIISDITVPALDKTFCLAASIFSHIYLRDLGFFSGIVAIMVTKLKMCVQSLINAGEVQGEENVEKLLWVLVVGGIAAWQKEERGFFLEKLLWLGASLPSGEGSKKVGIKALIREILWTRDWDQWFDML